MSSLQETLEQFQSFILNDEPAIEENISGNDEEFRFTRLNVYRHGYALRLLEILGKDFGGLQILIGCETFDKFGRDYIQSYPSNHFSVRYFGRHFSKFL